MKVIVKNEMLPEAEDVRDQKIEYIGENVDRLVTVDVNGRGIIGTLYPIARKLQEGPLTLVAAEKLTGRVKAGDYVLIATGLVLPKTLAPENDGPLGAVILARALDIALGARSVFLVNDEYVEMMRATGKAAGLPVLTLKELRDAGHGSSIVGFPIDQREANRVARTMMNELNPKAVIAVERRGPNEKGVYHSSNGMSMSDYEGKIGTVFSEAIDRGILTIGIVDGCGHEVGFGKIKDYTKDLTFVRKYANDLFSRHTKCTCPCGGGIADNTKVDTCVVASVSNWGAYGIASCIAAISGNLKVLHDREIETRMMRESSRCGAVDGLYNAPGFTADGITGEVAVNVPEMLGELVRNCIERTS